MITGLSGQWRLMTRDTLPPTGFLRLRQIIGDPKADPPIPAIYPISRAAWWDGVKRGALPAGVKLGPKTTAWRVEDIRELIRSVGAQSEGAGDGR